MKTKLALKVLAAISICLGTPAFAQTLSVSPNPVCVGQPVTVSLSGVCEEGGASATVNGNPVTLTDNGGGNWSGTYTTTTSDKGTKSCSASDNCNDTFNTVSLTVVELDGLIISANPSGSDWLQDGGGNYEALKSHTAGDVVTFGLDITPNNATAASLVTWNNATPSSDNTTATVPATAVLGPKAVSASACSFTTPIENVWIFWGTISYNFSGPLTSGDGLSFGDYSHLNLMPSSVWTSAGSVVGVTPNTTGTKYSIAVNDVEIIGTLAPSGIGSIVGNIFTFNPQLVADEIWSSNGTQSGTVLSSVTGSTSGTGHAQHNDTGLPEQTAPVSDQIFAIDTPGVEEVYSSSLNGYEANADNFNNYIYIGSVKASDVGTWYSRSKVTFTSGTPSASPCGASSGNPTLPTTWGSF